MKAPFPAATCCPSHLFLFSWSVGYEKKNLISKRERFSSIPWHGTVYWNVYNGAVRTGKRWISDLGWGLDNMFIHGLCPKQLFFFFSFFLSNTQAMAVSWGYVWQCDFKMMISPIAVDFMYHLNLIAWETTCLPSYSEIFKIPLLFFQRSSKWSVLEQDVLFMPKTHSRNGFQKNVCFNSPLGW